jgi:hypothetical protein
VGTNQKSGEAPDFSVFTLTKSLLLGQQKTEKFRPCTAWRAFDCIAKKPFLIMQ